MNTALTLVDIYEPISDVTGPKDHALEAPLRLSSKLRVINSEGDTPSREPIRIEELYSAPEVMAPELETGLRLLGEGLVFSEQALQEYEDGNIIAADDAIQKLQAVLPELFCCRSLGDGFGSVINAITSALQSLQGLPADPVQIRAINNALELVRTMPFLGTDVAITEISKLEETGLQVDPPGFDEFVSGVFDD